MGGGLSESAMFIDDLMNLNVVVSDTRLHSTIYLRFFVWFHGLWQNHFVNEDVKPMCVIKVPVASLIEVSLRFAICQHSPAPTLLLSMGEC